MLRKLTLTAVITSAIALPAMAQDKAKVDPATGGPTSTMTGQVPQMKSDAAQPTAKPTEPDKAMGAATPSMRPADAVSGAAANASGADLVLTDEQAKAWVGKPVYSKDDKKLGEVETIQRGPDNRITRLNAGFGGFLGIGETHVMLAPGQFKLEGDRVVISQTAVQAKDLPKVPK